MENCAEEAGKLQPLVDLSDCGGKGKCVPVCPYDVFEMRQIVDEDRKQLNFKGRIKTFFNKEKAYLKHPDMCHACGL